MENIFYINKSLFHSIVKTSEFIKDPVLLQKIAFTNRINALACIMSANHGWIGATFSCADLLTYLYFSKLQFEVDEKNNITGDVCILSKGHAAPIQYACLSGIGLITFESLLTYKTKNGLQAHTDISTPGIISNTGSLGQSLSKACGLAIANRLKHKRSIIYVVLGDGELQEGQNYEAFMTIKKYNLSEIVIIIDRNFLQTDSSIQDIKDVGELERLFMLYDFTVSEIDGNNMAQIFECFENLDKKKRNVIIADTIKGFGTSITAMTKETPRRAASWHSRIPDEKEYLLILDDLVKSVGCQEINNEYKKFKKIYLHQPESIIKQPAKGKSTRDIFSENIFIHAEKNKKIVVLDADLEKSMHLTEFALKYPDRFIEAGIAEQDMVSIAGGIALKKLIPIVNTYASFFRRAYEQIYMNATEKTSIIYAGHYSGLCYSTDGKSHQMTGDIPMMNAIPGMRVYDPFCNDELKNILNFYLAVQKKKNIEWDYPVYIKLRRTPTDFPLAMGASYKFSINKGYEFIRGKDICLLPAGPHLTSHCIKLLLEKKQYQIGLAVFSAQNHLDELQTCELFSRYNTIIALDEAIPHGGLADEVAYILHKNGLHPKMIKRGVADFTFSARDKSDIFGHFGLDIAGIESLINQVKQ